MNNKPLDANELLQQGCQQLGVVADQHIQQQWLAYLTLLQKWNASHNLIGKTDLHTVIIRHLLDSLTLVPYIQGPNIIDIGSGAGFPALPLAILLPHYQWVLLDARKKRCQFLHQVVYQLHLPHVTIQHIRAEQFTAATLFDQIVCRAVASAAQVLDYSAHLLKPTGTLWMMKGQVPQAEIAELDATQWQSKIVPVNVPFLSAERHLLAISRMPAKI